jgi:hypothetical protein
MSADLNQYLKLQQRLINEKSRIEARLTAINKVLGGDVSAVNPVPSATSKRGGARKFSAATKAKMAAAQKARWAKLKGKAAVVAAADPAPKKKRKMSAAGRAAIIAATKARWAKIRAAKAAAEAKPLKASK